MQWAAEEGHIGCVALMLRSALKKSDLANALLAAAKHGHEHTVHLLVEAGRQYMHMQPRAREEGERRGGWESREGDDQGRGMGFA